MLNEKSQNKKFDYAWVIIIISFLTVAISLGFCSSGRTMYLTAITDALGFKRGEFALNDTFRYVTTTIVNLFFGLLINKFGAKKLMCAGFLFLIAFSVINSLAEKLWLFYVGGICLGIGLSWTGTSMVSVVVNRWCTKNKGLITGATLAANGLGGAIAAQIISPIIFEEGNPFGYRNSYRLVTLILAIMLVLIIIFFRNAPKGAEKTVVPLKKQRKVRGTGWVGMEFSQAIKKPYFYVALLCMTLTGLSLQGLSGLGTPYMYDLGFDKSFVANLTTIGSLWFMCCKILTGFSYDKIGIKITMNICLVSCFISISGIFFLENTSLGKAIAICRAFFGNIAIPLETVMLPFFASELFGNKCFNKMVGIFVSASSLGFAFGSPFSNACYDYFGNYDFPIILYACLMIFVCMAMNIVMITADRDRKRILSQLQETSASSQLE